VKDIWPGPDGSFPIDLSPVGSTLYFYADDGTHGFELWKSDGTEASTVLVKDIAPGVGGSDPLFRPVGVGGTLYFGADDDTHGLELWKSDGTEAGTVLVKDIIPGGERSLPGGLTDVGGTLYFRAWDGTRDGLWRSDGTEAGTVMVRGIFPYELTDVGGTLYFRASDATHGREMWRSDGTEAGTAMVKDIIRDPAHLIPTGSQMSAVRCTSVPGTARTGENSGRATGRSAERSS